MSDVTCFQPTITPRHELFSCNSQRKNTKYRMVSTDILGANEASIDVNFESHFASALIKASLPTYTVTFNLPLFNTIFT